MITETLATDKFNPNYAPFISLNECKSATKRLLLGISVEALNKKSQLEVTIIAIKIHWIQFKDLKVGKNIVANQSGWESI